MFKEAGMRTQLDIELYFLLQDYVGYQLGLLKKVEQFFLNADQEVDLHAKREEIYGKKTKFTDSINQLFEGMGKVVDSDKKENLVFRQENVILTPYQLSSGEKQILIILLQVLLQGNEPSILLMDEPEISLHLECKSNL